MNYEIVTLEAKTLVGVQARTGNNDPMMSQTIGGLWQRFMEQGVMSSLKNTVNDHCICLYSDYDETSYDVTVGAEVSAADNSELSVKQIPAGSYAKFHIRGDVVKDVCSAWEAIWQMPLNRSFAGDFEEYLSNVDGVAEIDIYVALK